MNVRDLMNKDLVFCTPKSSLREAAQLMADNDCGCMLIAENLHSKHLTGVITDRDICCRAVAKGKDPNQTAVDQCMTKNAVTVSPDTSLEDCCRIMEQNQIRRIPVCDKNGDCIGVISQGDIAKATRPEQAAEVVREVSKPFEHASHVGFH